MPKKITEILPEGIAVFPKLQEVDVYQPKDKHGNPKGAPKRTFKTGIKFNDENHRKVDAWLEKCAKQLGAGPGRPWRKDKKTGELSLSVSTGEKYPPLLVDAKNRPIPADKIIGGGSTIKVKVSVNDYEPQGGGINLYLSAVQVIDLKENDWGKSPFDATEGYEAPEEGADEASPFDPHTGDDDTDF